MIDAFIASMIIIAALIFLFSRFVSPQPTNQPFYTAEDLLFTMDSTQVKDIDHPLARRWIADGTVKDLRSSLLLQLAIFEMSGNPGNTAGTLAEMLGNTTPSNINVEIIANGNSRYIRQTIDPDDAEMYFVAKRIVLSRKNAIETYDPCIVEVRTWQ